MSTKNKTSKLAKDLESGSESTVIKAISEIRKKGNSSYIKKLIFLLRTTKSEIIRKDIISLLNDLIDNKVVEVFVEELKNPENKEILSILVSSCWQSRLDFSNYLSDFIDIALKEDYVTTIEAISVVENILMEYEIDDLTITNQIFRIKEVIGECPKDKQPLIMEMVKILQNK